MGIVCVDVVCCVCCYSGCGVLCYLQFVDVCV